LRDAPAEWRTRQVNLRWNRFLRLEPVSIGFLRRSGAGRTTHARRVLRFRQLAQQRQ